MYLELTDEQRLLAQTIRAFLQKELPSSKVRGLMATQDACDPDLWQKMADQGWMSVTVPSEFGGMAGSWLTVAVIFEEFGRGVVPGPFLATVGFAAPLLAAAGSAEQKSRWLPAIAEGTCRATVAYLEPDGDYALDALRTTASRTTLSEVSDSSGGTYRLSGTKMFVLDAGVADMVIVAASEEGEEGEEGEAARARDASKPGALSLFLVEKDASGMTVESLDGMDLSRRLTRVTLNQTPAQKLDACTDARHALDHALHAACLALSAESVGGMQWILDTAVAYARSREQYGHLIGSYQGVAYPLVDRTLDLTSARSAVYNAAYALDHRPDECREAVSMAKALVGDSYRQAGYTGVQTLGGIGFTWEHDMQLYFRRASGSWSLFGDAIWHREQLLHSLQL